MDRLQKLDNLISQIDDRLDNAETDNLDQEELAILEEHRKDKRNRLSSNQTKKNKK
jgi:hypothetical protein